MVHPHHLHNLLRGGPRLLLFNQLREDLFQIGKPHQTCKIVWSSVGDDPALCDYNDAVTDLLHNLHHM